MNNLEIRCIADTKCTLGEGPVWDEADGCLWWVDILENRIFRYNLVSEYMEWWKTPEHAGFIVLKKNGGLIAGLKSGLHHVELRENQDISVRRIDRVDEQKDFIRFNDGICDSRGRIWGCTMDMNQKAPLGKYICYDKELNGKVVDEGYVVANGPALSPHGNILYTVETVGGPALQKGIFMLESGKKKLLIDWSEYDTFPDGIITDSDGNLWIGEFGGNTLRSFSPQGMLILEIKVPGWSVTKPVFGGKEKNVLFVTTARYAAGEKALKNYPQTGGVFEIRGTGVIGQPTAYF